MQQILEKTLMERIKNIPIFDTLQFEIYEVNENSCKAKIPRNPNYDGIYKSVHGGILMTIADSLAAVVLLNKTHADKNMATTDMNIRFFAPCKTDVYAEAKLERLGKTLALVTVSLYDENGKRAALAQVNYMLLN